jgi:hypothetical protein
VVELPWAADSCPWVEVANRVTIDCWYQRQCGAVGVDSARWGGSHAVQELLKACDCRLRQSKGSGAAVAVGPRVTRTAGVSVPDELGEEGTPDVEVEGEGLSFWTDLPAHCRDVIAPCLSSGYVMRQLVKPASAVPIFAHNRAWSFRQWLNMWCRHLLSSAGGPRAVVLHACQVGKGWGRRGREPVGLAAGLLGSFLWHRPGLCQCRLRIATMTCIGP